MQQHKVDRRRDLRCRGARTEDAGRPLLQVAFQAVIWCGWTSNSLANSASVFSPLIAASATFALKPGLCVRRARFVILAPDPRHLRRCQAEKPLIGLSEFPEPPLRERGPYDGLSLDPGLRARDREADPPASAAERWLVAGRRDLCE